MDGPPINFAAPAPQLQPFVEAYWHLDCEGGLDEVQSYIPGVSLAWIFNLDAPAGILRGQELGRLPQCFVKGPTSIAAHTMRGERMRNYGVAFKPGAATAFHSLPIGELQNEFVDVFAMQDRGFRQLARDVVAMEFAEAVRHFDRYLATRLRDATDPSLGRLLFAKLDRDLEQPLSRLVGASGYSERHLRRLFHETLGASPKTVSRIGRLRQAVADMSKTTLTLSQIAVKAGYCDQAHLNRDFREMIGCNPSAYRTHASAIAKRFNSFESNPRPD